MRSLLNLENLRAVLNFKAGSPRRRLVVSVNPDLIKDFGHFLNYEHRIKECCEAVGATYVCFCNKKTDIQDQNLLPIFSNDSGYYSLTRRAAAGNEKKIADELFTIVQSELEKLPGWLGYDDVYIFLYCGSSLLASYLSDCRWDRRVIFVINAFWDFLLPNDFRGYPHVARIMMQQRVRLLAMSELHQQEIERESGHRFDWIPNPPPLVNDEKALALIKAQASDRRGRQGCHILLPGLMSAGKGKDFTTEYCNFINGGGAGRFKYSVRDRLGVLPKSLSEQLELVIGDLSHEEVLQLYGRSDFAVLPYEPETFGVRTSGAIVDCLMLGVVPIVRDGTWLAYICKRYDFGIVLQNMAPSDVQAVIEKTDREKARQKVTAAAFGYLNDNSWDRFGAVILTQKPRSPTHASTGSTTTATFADANRLLREGRYFEAGKIYQALSETAGLSIYKTNLAWCARKVGLSVDEFCRALPQ